VGNGPAIPPNVGEGVESSDRRREQHREQHQQKDHDGLQLGHGRHGSLISPRGGIDLEFGEYESSAVGCATRLFAASWALRSS
jgi:hypothetical protein